MLEFKHFLLSHKSDPPNFLISEHPKHKPQSSTRLQLSQLPQYLCFGRCFSRLSDMKQY